MNSELVGAFPNYFKNHPNCVKNNSCAGVFAACNSNCPAPTDADRAVPVPACDGAAGQWAGCRGTGCLVCSETTRAYPYYFVNHPGCVKNLTCEGSFFTCNASCPAPTEADKRPAPGQCIGTPGQWNACRGDGCSVCSESLTNHPFYFHHHPSCHRNDLCGDQLFTCNDSCPAPTDKEKSPPAGTCNGTSGQWAGCRGNGCSVCAEKLTAFPNYFKNHPSGYVASFWPLFGVFDLGISGPRALGYYLDQALDPNFGAKTALIPFYRSAGCIPELSPDGMVQPVGFRPGGDLDPHHRYHNHFSFLQTAANHRQPDEDAAEREPQRVELPHLIPHLRQEDLEALLDLETPLPEPEGHQHQGPGRLRLRERIDRASAGHGEPAVVFAG
ncbi:MAG: hypothetical protein QOI66_3844 [Myxococcales bacterium]|jgi:hypothetical protein|nr:hypothetical protein [Myxococcales bacterium]